MKRYIYVLALIVLALAIAGCGSSGGGSTVVNDTKAIEAGLREFENALDLTRVDMDVSVATEAVKMCSYNIPTNPFLSLNIWYQIEKYTFTSWDIAQSGSTAVIHLKYTVTDSVDKTVSDQRMKTFTMQKYGVRWLVNLKEFAGLD